MGKSNILVLFFFSFIYLGSMTYLVKECYDKNEQLISLHQEYVYVLDFNERILDFEEWVTEVEAKEKLDRAERIKTEIEEYNAYLVQYGYVILFVSVLYVLILYLSFSPKKRLYVLIFTGIFVSIVVLMHGVFNPIMEIGAFKDDIQVKAKLSPSKLEGYAYSKTYADSMNIVLENKIDSVIYVAKNNLLQYDSMLLEVKTAVKKIENLVGNIPFVGEESKSKIEELNNTLTEIEITKNLPFGEISSSIKQFNKVLLDSLKNRADLYAGETYGFDKTFEGKTYFYYEIKSIYSVIKTLWTSENYIVSICVGLFSILVPAIKISLSLVLLIFGKIKQGRITRFIGSISKWSMADVFVLAAFLAYLSFSQMRTGISIEANLKYGFFFFLLYVLISMVLSILLNRYLKIRENQDIQASMLE